MDRGPVVLSFDLLVVHDALYRSSHSTLTSDPVGVTETGRLVGS